MSASTESRRIAPVLVDLLQGIELAPDPSRQGRFDQMTLDLLVECDDGTVIVTRCDRPPGVWGRPAGADLLRAKAGDCMNATLGAARGERVLELASAVAGFRAADLSNLMALMGERLPSQDAAPHPNEDHRQ